MFSDLVFSYVNVCNLGQDGGRGYGDLEERCLVKKKEGAAGVLGAGSFPFGQERVLGAWCLRKVPMEVLETGV